MFCIDEIHTPEKSYTDVIGGAGTFAALGAAVVVPKSERSQVGFLCDEGYDFPESLSKTIQNWGMGLIVRKDMSRETTKAWNKFVNGEERLFKYLSPKRQVFPQDLTPAARAAKVMHLICSPQRCDEILANLKDNSGQIYVWEPVPTQCIPSQFESLKTVVQKYGIQILSPNALEAASLVGLPEPTTEEEVELLVDNHFQFAQNVVIRCGSMGSYVRSGGGLRRFFPAYFADEPQRVVDPTGAGNAFTGAMGIPLAKNCSWIDVIAMASVGASFMIEQVGTPRYDAASDTWNGETWNERYVKYLKRISAMDEDLDC